MNMLRLTVVFLAIFFTASVGFSKTQLPVLVHHRSDDYAAECFKAMKYFKQYTFGLEAPVYDEKEKVEWILENNDLQVQEVVGGKIYLNPTSLIHSEFGVFLRVQDFVIVKISNLYADENGYYISIVE